VGLISLFWEKNTAKRLISLFWGFNQILSQYFLYLRNNTLIMGSSVQDTLMGSSSVEAEAIATLATIDMSSDNNQGAEDGEVPDLIEVRKEEARQREIRRETLRKRLASNSSALRKTLMSETIRELHSSLLRMEEMSVTDIMSEIPDEDLPHVGTTQDRVYMTADFFRKWVRPTI
jgi:hypothetical protein